MKKSTLALILATLALLITAMSTCAQDSYYGYRETYQNNKWTRNIDTVKISIDTAHKLVVITEQVGDRISVNCFAIVAPVLDNSIASQYTLKALSLNSDNADKTAYLSLDKTLNVMTYACGYTTYLFDNNLTKELGSKKLTVARKRKKTDLNHYSFLNF